MKNPKDRVASPMPPALERLGSAAFFVRLRRQAAKPLRHLRPTALRRTAADLLLVCGLIAGFALALNLVLRLV